MTTKDFYMVDVPEFSEHVNYRIQQNTDVEDMPLAIAAMFAVVESEIHFLEKAWETLRAIPLPEWRDSMPLVIAIGDKLKRKEAKLARYVKELL